MQPNSTARMRARAKLAPPLSHAHLKEILRYEPETGKFFWLIRPRRRSRVGDEAGSDHGNGYIEIGVKGRRYMAHRLAWFYVTGEWPPALVDHKDLSRSNNRWSNLRLATHGQNVQNTPARSNSSTGIKGITFCRSVNKWHARIMHEYRLHLLGYFPTQQEARAAYAAAAVRLHGEFARIA